MTEDELKERQGDLLEAMTERLRTGPPLSEQDLAVADGLARILGLGPVVLTEDDLGESG